MEDVGAWGDDRGKKPGGVGGGEVGKIGGGIKKRGISNFYATANF